MFWCRPRWQTTIKLNARRLDNLLESEIVHFSKKLATPLESRAILELKDPEQAGQVLLRELPVRFSARIKDLKSLPEQIEEFIEVRDIFVTSFKHLRMCTTVTKADIQELKIRHQRVVPVLLGGLRKAQVQKLLTEEYTKEEAIDGRSGQMDEFCNRFFLSRIGTEMLSSQYLSIDSPQQGILQDANPVVVANWAVQSITDFTKQVKGIEVPSKITYYGPENATISYPPSYLFYILSELLKNSFRAHCEYEHRSGLSPKGFDAKKEPVRVAICADEGQFAIKVEDRGGGIPFEFQNRIWSYLFSTANTPEIDQ
eukprot:GEMP01010540.1.p1 GENE.GEMP01010540.1~~GEMP01010540.1.p1  ORF type:complete len:313 (+),score=44.65 GEMP01010540.1:193-1131(+)